jgi:porphobilinogen deaminase
MTELRLGTRGSQLALWQARAGEGITLVLSLSKDEHAIHAILGRSARM